MGNEPSETRGDDDDPNPHLQWPPRKVDTDVWTPPASESGRSGTGRGGGQKLFTLVQTPHGPLLAPVERSSGERDGGAMEAVSRKRLTTPERTSRGISIGMEANGAMVSL